MTETEPELFARLTRERTERLPAALYGLGVDRAEEFVGEPRPCDECGLLPDHPDGWLPGEYLMHARKEHQP